MTPKTPTPPASVAVYSYEEIIGDGLYKIPVARALRSAFPEARIAWVTTRRTVLAGRLRPLTEGLIDVFYEDSGIGDRPAAVLAPMPRTIPERFDVVIDTQSVVWRSLHARRLSRGLFVSPAARWLLSDRRPPKGQPKARHMVDRLLGLLELASGRKAELSAAVSIPADLAAKAERLLPDGPTYVGFAPGAGKRVKCWPLEGFIAVAREQAARGRVPVFILGPDEVEWTPRLAEAAPTALFPEQAAEVWGDGFSPLRTVALARRFGAALANDSGVSHMFGAADVPLLTLYGPTDAEKFRPRVSRGLILRAQDFGGEDMAAIPVEAVSAALDGLLR